jgi:AsmA protein
VESCASATGRYSPALASASNHRNSILTAATGFKRLGLAVAALVAAGFGALAVASLLIPADAVREAVKAEIRALTGVDPVLGGDISVSLFPSGSVSFTNVGLGDGPDDQRALTAERLDARLRLFPLLAGRVRVSDVSLVRPTLAITFDPAGRSNWSGLLQTLGRAQTPSAIAGASFSEIRVSEGTIVLRDASRGIDERFTDAELSLAWPSISRSFAVTGRFAWRGKAVDAGVTVSDFAAALAGNRSGLKVRLAGTPLKVAFDGHMGYRPTLKLEGTLAADAASLREALRWTGQKPLPGGGFGRFALKAQTNVVGGTIALSSVNIELDGNTAEGVLTFASDGRQIVQGTLATDSLDLTPYVSTVRLLTGRERDWNSIPISLDGLTGFDLDLRLSAAKVTLPGTALGRTAVGANLRGGRLTVAIGESQAFGGVITGSFGLANSENGADLKAQLQFAEVDLESCLGELFGLRKIEGRGNLALALEGSGHSVLALTRTLNGSASLSGRQGALAGLNVEQLLRRLERRPLSGGGDFRSGRTLYTKLAVTVKIAQGTASVEDVHIEGPAVRLAVAGSASIPARDLDLKGTASLLATANDSPPTFELPFVVQGPWDDPVMLPDPQILLRRSPGSAPLFDALRERRARDALRSAVERLTGPAVNTPETPAAPEPQTAATPAAAN